MGNKNSKRTRGNSKVTLNNIKPNEQIASKDNVEQSSLKNETTKVDFWGSNKLGNIIQIFMAALTLASVIIVMQTLNEMKMEREIASRPLLVMKPIQQSIEWNANGDFLKIGEVDEEDDESTDNDMDNLSYTDQMVIPMRYVFASNDSLAEYSIINIGEGIAHDISIQWHNENMNTLNRYLVDEDNTYADFYVAGTDYDKFDYGENQFVVNKEKVSRILYLQPNVEDDYSLYFPAQYSIMAAELIKKHLVDDNSPIMYMIINFTDVQGIDYSEWLGISITQIEFQENVDGSGSATFQFVPELKSFEKGKISYKEK